jgi:hypothetical protein
MPSTPKSNRLKRKRGKKFIWKDPSKMGPATTPSTTNPFEEHSTAKRARRDLESVSYLKF